MEGGEARLRAWPPTATAWPWPTMPAPEGAVGSPGVIVPRKTIQEARRLLDDAGEDVEFSVSAGQGALRISGRAALTLKVIDGAFPDYVRVIPKDNQKAVTVDNGLFSSAVDRVATISAEKSRSVKLAIEPAA